MVAARALWLCHQLLTFLQGVYLPNAIIAQLGIQTERRHGLGCILEDLHVTLLSIEGTPTEVCISSNSLDAREGILVAHGVSLLRTLLEVVLAHAV